MRNMSGTPTNRLRQKDLRTPCQMRLYVIKHYLHQTPDLKDFLWRELQLYDTWLGYSSLSRNGNKQVIFKSSSLAKQRGFSQDTSNTKFRTNS